MLNYIWLGLIAVAVLLGGYQGNIGEVGDAATIARSSRFIPLPSRCWR